MITPTRFTTPRNSLEVIYDLIPLDLYGTYEAVMLLTRQEESFQQNWIGTNSKYKMNYWILRPRKIWALSAKTELGNVGEVLL